MLFNLSEYADAEARFIARTIDALSNSRGGLVGQISREPSNRTGTTQVTTDHGETVEFESMEIAARMTLTWEDIAAGNIEALLITLDEAAEEHHKQLTDMVLTHLDRLTQATGNQVDASGKSFFEYMYEMFDTIELSFNEDGQISDGYAFVMHPDTAEIMKKKEAEMTLDEHWKLDELIERKRKEFFARRRRRKLS